MTQLDKINSPADVKKLSMSELSDLSSEIRSAILNRVSKVGGHVGPNLGMVETIVALHYVFNSPKDKIVFDVSHQSYAHKILTGRKHGFLDENYFKEISGYTNPNESEHDFFMIGHTSTSVSLACGLAKSRDIKGEKHNVIAVIGDGSVGGGEALEGFNFASELMSNLIIVVNDNEMSIAENYGGLYQNLKLLRQTKGKAECNMFKAWGLDYHYVENGNSTEDMIDIFNQVKDTNKPTVIHIHTTKGKGYSFAEENREPWHYNMPFDIDSGVSKYSFDGGNYNDITADYLIEKAKQDSKVVVVNAGTPGAIGFTADKRQQMGKNYVDVGIAEEHAVAMVSAMAKDGCKPVFWVLSPFVQRTYDQLSHDLALNNNPAVILVSWNGIMPNDATHMGSFDIPLISNIPNIVHLAPTTKQEYLAMLDWAIEQKQHPVVIRIPSAVINTDKVIDKNYENLNRFLVEKQGSEVAIIALGSFWALGEEVAQKLNVQGIAPTIINPRFISGIDEELLNNLKANHKLVITLEDGEVNGGFGEKIASFYGASNMRVLNFGAKKEFTDRIDINTLYQRYHLTPELIVQDINEVLNKI